MHIYSKHTHNRQFTASVRVCCTMQWQMHHSVASNEWVKFCVALIARVNLHSPVRIWTLHCRRVVASVCLLRTHDGGSLPGANASRFLELHQPASLRMWNRCCGAYLSRGELPHHCMPLGPPAFSLASRAFFKLRSRCFAAAVMTSASSATS